jgi:uncharacterized protein
VGQDVLGFLAGFLLAAVAAPVGVSGAVFLLPVQLTVLGVPNPQLTPTNLLYNVVAGPGALLAHLRRGRLGGPLTRQLIAGAAPGVVVGSVLRVHVIDDPDMFRLMAAAVLFPTGLAILSRSSARSVQSPSTTSLRAGIVVPLALTVGIVGGIYGIGGGSILGPILVGAGMSLSVVAPAALASTYVTSLIGVAAFVVLAHSAPGSVAPDWSLGLACGLGGLFGGYLGARLQPRLPERALRGLLGLLAVGLSAMYMVQAVT